MTRRQLEIRLSADVRWHEAELLRRELAFRHALLLLAGEHVAEHVRTRILRRRKEPSRPGEPPSIHAPGDGGLRAIDYQVTGDATAVYAGPKLASRAGQSVPAKLEHGGETTIHEAALASGRRYPNGRRWRRLRTGQRPRQWERSRRRRVTVEPRPFMGPGLEQTAPDLPKLANGLFARVS